MRQKESPIRTTNSSYFLTYLGPVFDPLPNWRRDSGRVSSEVKRGTL